MELLEKLNELQDRVKTIWAKANDEGRDLTTAEETEVGEILKTAEEVKRKTAAAKRSQELLASIGGTAGVEHLKHGAFAGDSLLGDTRGHMSLSGTAAKTLAKSMTAEIRRTMGQKAFVASGALTSAVPLTEGPIELGRIPTSVLEVLTTVQHDNPTWRYLRQTAATNNAAIVAPGDVKPTSVYTVDDVDGALQVFAHLSEYVDEYLLRDNDQLADFLARQLLYGLQQKVEQEVISGAGTAGHLLGILSTSGIQTQAFATDKLTTLRTAQLKLENAGYVSDVFIVNIADWAAIETYRNTSGNFDLNGPIDRAAQKIWGTQVVTSGRIPAGTAIAMDLNAAHVDTDTQGIQIKWDTSTGFDKNQVKARVEGRFGVSVTQPFGIVKATITGP
ncbi:phage major capsid protein [Microbacterium lacticum]